MDILKKYGMHESKALNTLMAARIVPSDLVFDQKEYQRITGSEMWPSLGCRFDIAYTTAFLARFNLAPTTAHHSAQMHLLRYLRGTVGFRIHYSASCSEGLAGFMDAD